MVHEKNSLYNIERVRELFSKIRSRLRSNQNKVTPVDLSKADLAGSAFLNALAKLIRNFPEKYWLVEFHNVPKNLFDLMETCGFTKLVKTFKKDCLEVTS
jgi:ABC-type transporter Mla MlaB component